MRRIALWIEYRAKDKVAMWFAWRLPRRIVMWASLRMIANATQGQYGATIASDLSAMDALKRWE